MTAIDTGAGAEPKPLAPRTTRGINRIGVGSLMRREVLREISFFKLAVLGPALQAALFAGVFTLAMGAHVPVVGALPFPEFLAPGLIFVAMAQRAFESSAYTIIYDKLETLVGDVFGAPLSTTEILVGYTASSTGIGLLIGASVWLVLLPLGAGLPAEPLVALYFAVVSGVIMSLLGLLAGIQSDRWDSLSGKEVFILGPLLFLSGTFFSVEVLAEPFRSIMAVNPIYYMIDGFRYGMTGQFEAPVWIGATLCLALAAVLWIVCLRVLDSGYKIKA